MFLPRVIRDGPYLLSSGVRARLARGINFSITFPGCLYFLSIGETATTSATACGGASYGRGATAGEAGTTVPTACAACGGGVA